MRDAYFTREEQYSPMTLLSREDDRRLRAKAWRHVRRINPSEARRIWRDHHPKPERINEPAIIRAVRKWGGARLFGKKSSGRKWRLYDFTRAHYAAEVRK